MADTTIDDMMDLDWANPTPNLWMAFLPAIPGYCDPRYVNAVAEVEKHEDRWGYQLDIAVKQDGSMNDLVFLSNKDFQVEDGASATDMKRMVGTLTLEQIKAKLREKGYEPTYPVSD